MRALWTILGEGVEKLLEAFVGALRVEFDVLFVLQSFLRICHVIKSFK